MTIPTQMSLHGFIATAPELNFIGKGHARFHCRVGVEHFRKEVDESFTKLDPTFHDLVTFDRASGYVHEYEQERRGEPSQIRAFGRGAAIHRGDRVVAASGEYRVVHLVQESDASPNAGM